MNFTSMTTKEILNYAKPSTDLEVALYERLKDARDEIESLEDEIFQYQIGEL